MVKVPECFFDLRFPKRISRSVHGIGAGYGDCMSNPGMERDRALLLVQPIDRDVHKPNHSSIHLVQAIAQQRILNGLDGLVMNRVARIIRMTVQLRHALGIDA